MKKIAVFIDGANIHSTTTKLGLKLDFRKLLDYLGEGVVTASYYTAVRPRSLENDPLVPLLDWLSFNGFLVVKKETKEFTDEFTGVKKIKGNMDIEIVCDALERPFVDDVWLFSGDGDFVALVNALHRRGQRVTVVSSVVAPMCADELRRVADVFIDVNDLVPALERQTKKSRFSNG